MKEKLSKFFKILEVEFLDLEEGLAAYLEAVEERYRKKEITQYVYRENDALLAREIKDVEMIRNRIMSLSEDAYENLDDAVKTVEETIKGFTGIPEAVHRYMERKVQKVQGYVTVLGKKC